MIRLQRNSSDQGFFSFLLPKLPGGLRMFFAKVDYIKMSVGVIAYSQLMLVCQAEYFRQLLKPVT